MKYPQNDSSMILQAFLILMKFIHLETTTNTKVTQMEVLIAKFGILT